MLCSHEHLDHFDAEAAPAIARSSPRAVFVVPTPIVDMVTEVGIAPDRIVGMQPGESLDLAGFRISAVAARHGVTPEDAYDFGEKLSGGNKTAIEDALADLRKAHESKDLAQIDTAMTAINAAWQAASQEMYAQGGQPGADGAAGNPFGGDGQAPNGQQGQPQGADNVTDVDYEEVGTK